MIKGKGEEAGTALYLPLCLLERVLVERETIRQTIIRQIISRSSIHRGSALSEFEQGGSADVWVGTYQVIVQC